VDEPIFDVAVRPGETTEVQLDLQRGISVSGRVTLGGKPVPGARLVFVRYLRKRLFDSVDAASTDEQGNYRIDLPGVGSYKVTLRRSKPESHLGREIVLGPLLEIGKDGNQTRDLHFSAGQIRGRLIDSGSKPISGYLQLFQLLPTDESDTEKEFRSESFFQETDEQGKFEFEPLPVADYRLDLHAPGLGSRSLGPLALGQDQTIDLQDVILDSEMSLRVLAMDPQGKPLPGVTVRLSSDLWSASESMARSGGTTDDSGEATLGGLSAGTYTLLGLGAGLPPAFVENIQVSAEQPETPLILRFTAGGSLDIEIRGKTGEPVPYVVPELTDGSGRNVTPIYRELAARSQRAWLTDLEGRAHLDAVLPGEYLLQASADGKSEEKRITLLAGTATRIVMTVEDE